MRLFNRLFRIQTVFLVVCASLFKPHYSLQFFWLVVSYFPFSQLVKSVAFLGHEDGSQFLAGQILAQTFESIVEWLSGHHRCDVPASALKLVKHSRLSRFKQISHFFHFCSWQHTKCQTFSSAIRRLQSTEKAKPVRSPS